MHVETMPLDRARLSDMTLLRQDCISNAVLTKVFLSLAADGTGIIINSTLTNTYVDLKNGSILKLTEVHQGLGSILNNNSATAILSNHTIKEHVGLGNHDGGIRRERRGVFIGNRKKPPYVANYKAAVLLEGCD